jgi:hypothetical protein
VTENLQRENKSAKQPEQQQNQYTRGCQQPKNLLWENLTEKRAGVTWRNQRPKKIKDRKQLQRERKL